VERFMVYSANFIKIWIRRYCEACALLQLFLLREQFSDLQLDWIRTVAGVGGWKDNIDFPSTPSKNAKYRAVASPTQPGGGGRRKKF